MVNNPIDIKNVFKRKRYLEKRKSINEAADTNYNFFDNKIKKLFENCKTFSDVAIILEELYQNSKFDLLESSVQEVINYVIPLTESDDLNTCISNIALVDIGDINKDRITETAKMYKSIDRMIKNHTALSKRFEMDSLKGKSDRDRCFRVCEMVDTYKQSPMAKFNIVLEEVKFLNMMDGIHMSDKNLTKHVTDYFLMSENYTGDKFSYGDAIKNSKVLDNTAADLVPYVMEGVTYNATGIEKSLNEWMVDPYREIKTLIEMVRNNYSDVSIINHLIDRINEYTSIHEIEFDPIHIFDEMGSVNAYEATNITKIIKENNISNADDLLFNLKAIWEAEKNDTSYGDTKIFSNDESIPVEDVGNIRMNNLITDAQAAGEFLDHLEKTSMKESPVSIKKILTTVSDEDLNESNIIDHIDANGFLTINVRSYVVEGNIEEAINLIDGAVNCINNALYSSDSKAYYNLSESGFDICIRSKYNISMNEDCIRKRGFSNSDAYIIAIIESCTNSLEKLEKSPLIKIAEKMVYDKDYAASVPFTEVALIQEMLNPFIDTNNSILESLIENCDDEANSQYYMMKDIPSYNIMHEEMYNPYSDDINIERINLCAEMMGITESEDINNNGDANNHNDEASVGKKKKEFPIKSFNDIKLAWNGVKAKMKNASAKEQEMCRDMDIQFNHMLKTIKSAGPDHREELITGEVNHSLSKALKIAIALSGVGVAAGSAMVPILGALAIFIRSKHTTYKEKKMILDEIDIELQILDREISRAEQSGSTKKYRQLLTIQKNLQRKRQEIHYGLAKKGKRIPMQATAGLRNRE